jgi:hypothetical protein
MILFKKSNDKTILQDMFGLQFIKKKIEKENKFRKIQYIPDIARNLQIWYGLQNIWFFVNNNNL